MRSKNLNKIALLALLNVINCGEGWSVNTNRDFLILDAKILVNGFNLDIGETFRTQNPIGYAQGYANNRNQLKGHILTACLFANSPAQVDAIRTMMEFGRRNIQNQIPQPEYITQIQIPQPEYILLIIDGQIIKVPRPAQSQLIRNAISRIDGIVESPEGVVILDVNKADLKLNKVQVVQNIQLFEGLYTTGPINISLNAIADESYIPTLTAACLLSEVEPPLGLVIGSFRNKGIPLPTLLPNGGLICVFDSDIFDPSKACILTNRQSQGRRNAVKELLNIREENTKTGVLYLTQGIDGVYLVKKYESRNVPLAYFDPGSELALPRDSLEFRVLTKEEEAAMKERPIDKTCKRPGEFYDIGYCRMGGRYRYSFMIAGEDGSNKIVLFVNGRLVRSNVIPMVRRDAEGLVKRDEVGEIPNSNGLAFCLFVLYRYEDEVDNLEQAIRDGVFAVSLPQIQSCLRAEYMYVQQGGEIRKVGPRTLNANAVQMLEVGDVEQGSHLIIKFNDDSEPTGFELTKINPMPDVKEFSSMIDWDCNPGRIWSIQQNYDGIQVRAADWGHSLRYQIRGQTAYYFEDDNHNPKAQFTGEQLVYLLAWCLSSSNLGDRVTNKLESMLSQDQIAMLKTILKHNVHRSDARDIVQRPVGFVMSKELRDWIGGKATHPVDCIIYFQNGVPQKLEWATVKRREHGAHRLLQDNLRDAYTKFLQESGVDFNPSDDTEIVRLQDAVSVLVANGTSCRGQSPEQIYEMFEDFKRQPGEPISPRAGLESRQGDVEPVGRAEEDHAEEAAVEYDEDRRSHWMEEQQYHYARQREDEVRSVGQEEEARSQESRNDFELESDGDESEQGIGIEHVDREDKKKDPEEEYAGNLGRETRRSWFNRFKYGFRMMIKWLFFGWIFDLLFDQKN